MLSTMLLRANATLTAQTPSPPANGGTPAPAPAPEVQPPESQKKESFEEKWLSFDSKAISAKWGWMLMFDGLAMTQDSVNEQQVGHVPAKGEPRADRFYIGRQPRVVSVAAADVETRTAADLGQQRQERGRVQRVAIDVPPLPRQRGPGASGRFPIASNLAGIQAHIVTCAAEPATDLPCDVFDIGPSLVRRSDDLGISLRLCLQRLSKPRDQVQFPEHGTLLRLMTVHPAEDVVQHMDRLHHVRPLVEHDAFRPVRHRRVGDLGPRRQAVLRETLEHLAKKIAEKRNIDALVEFTLADAPPRIQKTPRWLMSCSCLGLSAAPASIARCSISSIRICPNGGKLPGSTANANTTVKSVPASCLCTEGEATATQSLWQWSGLRRYSRTLSRRSFQDSITSGSKEQLHERLPRQSVTSF